MSKFLRIRLFQQKAEKDAAWCLLLDEGHWSLGFSWRGQLPLTYAQTGLGRRA